MPENYAHQRTAAKAYAAVLGGEASYALLMGATGPDIFFYHKVVTGGDKYKLPKLGTQMHQARTGRFLRTLVEEAETPVQRDYAMGFLCHYAADHWVHPYVEAQTAPGAPFARDGGHGYLEMAIDAQLYLEDHPEGTAWEPPLKTHAVYHLSEAALREIAALLQRSVAKVFDRADISAEKILECFTDMCVVKEVFNRPNVIKWHIFRAVEKLLRIDAKITSHCYPRRMPEGDFMNRERRRWGVLGESLSVDECFEQAVLSGAAYLRAAQQLWQGTLSAEAFEDLLGNRSYVCNQRDSATD